MHPVLFATDYDGTLFFHDKGGLRQSDVKAIEEFRKNGHLLVLDTGRPWTMWEDMDQFDLKGKVPFDYRIFSNGALILDKNGQILHEQFIDDDFVRYALKAYEGSDLFVHAARQSPFYRKDPSKWVSILEENPGPYYLYGISFPVRNENEIAKRDDLLGFPGVQGYANPMFQDIVAADVSKGKTLLKLAGMLDIPVERTAAMGDSWNDLPMLEKAGTSFTFPSSPQDVQEAADRIESSLAGALQSMDKEAREYDMLLAKEG